MHNAIVIFGWPERLPAALIAALALAAAYGTGQCFAAPGWAALILALASATDLALLWALPRLGRSFGRIQGPLALFTVGRHASALLTALLPAGVDIVALLGVQLLLSGCSLWGHLVAPFRVEIVRVSAPILRQEPTRPVRLVLLTDLHVERLTRRERIVLELVRGLEPDLVLFGGDLLNLSFLEDPRAHAEARDFLATLLERHALRAVLGNPTVEDRRVVPAIWKSLGVTPLEGEAERLELCGAAVALYGLGASRDPNEDGERLAALWERRPAAADEAAVLLYHLPDLADQLTRLAPGVDLYLCGHTHGGQIRLPGIGPLVTASRARRALASGTHRVPALAHTSRGLGMEGSGMPRMRFFCRPEVTLLTLTSRQRPRAGGL
ncbi:MAG: metallophosphoesterase [bacterium]